MLDSISSLPKRTQSKKKANDIKIVTKQLSKLSKEIDPFLGPIQWVMEIEKEKRTVQLWKGIAIFSLAHLAITYFLLTIVLIKSQFYG